MRYMVLMIPGRKDVEAGAPPPAEVIARMMKFNQELAQAGVLLALDGLQPTAKGARLRFAGGKSTVTDGPFAEAREVIGGFWLWQVRSREEAIEWASRCPAEDGDVLEIRLVYETADFGPEVVAQERELADMVGRRAEENRKLGGA